MFANERLHEILNILKKDGKVKVKDLSIKFNVTEDCIRKDLKTLEKDNNLKRIYGGAVLTRETFTGHDIKIRKESNTESKQIIAEKAFDLIKENETIFLDISTTNILLAKLLASNNKRVTIVTNMLDVLNVVSSYKHNLTIISVGGVLNSSLDGFVGACAIDFISKYKFDKSFIGSCGVDVFDSSLSAFDIEDGITKSKILNCSKKGYLVIENNKFNIDGNYKFCSLEDIDGIITDTTPNQETLDILSELNISIF